MKAEENLAMQNEDAEGYESNTQQSRRQRAIEFIKRHGLEIVLGAGLCVVGGICIKQGSTIGTQKEAIAAKDGLIEKQAERICRLVARHEEKDSRTLRLASDALRHGSSEGGKALVDWRDYSNGRYWK